MENQTLAISVQVKWQQRIIDQVVFQNRQKISLGASKNCDLQLPGYSKSLGQKFIGMDDFISRGSSKIQFSYLNGLMKVEIELGEAGEKARRDVLVPLSFGDQVSLTLSLALTAMLLLYMSIYKELRPTKLVDSKEPLKRLARIEFKLKPKPKPKLLAPVKNKKAPKKNWRPTWLQAAKKISSQFKNKQRGSLSVFARSRGNSKAEIGGDHSVGQQLRSSGGGDQPKSVKLGPIGMGRRGTGDFPLAGKSSVAIDLGGAQSDFRGTMDREAIRRVIQGHLSEIRFCYEKHLNRNKDLFGKITLRWDIHSKGRVSTVKIISDSMGSSGTAKCLVRKLKTWRFPEPPENSTGRVTYPFVFVAK